MRAAGSAPSPGRPRVNLRFAGLGLVVVAALAREGWRFYEQRATAGRLFASGSIEATEVDVSPKIPGRVTRLLAQEGDQVRAGQVLVEMETGEAGAQVDQARAAVVAAEARVAQARQAVTTQQQVTDAQVAQAEAQLAAAEARVPQAEAALLWQSRTVQEAVASAQAQLSAAQAQVSAARSALAKARDDLRRAKELFGQGAVAEQQVDAAQAAYDAAVAQDRGAEQAVTQAQAALATARANELQVAIRQQDVEVSRHAVAEARAALRNAQTGRSLVAQRRQDLSAAEAMLAQARANLKYLEIVASHNSIAAPAGGVILMKHIEAGEVVAAGAPIFTLINPDDTWLRVFIPEDQIGRVKTGQQARVMVDSFPGRTFLGRVVEISTRAEFTPGNVQTREDRVKQVFGVKVQLENRDRSLKPGMPADAEILVGGPEEQGRR